MCKCLSKKQLQTLGLVATCAFAFLLIFCIFIQGFDYQQLDMRWTSHGEWRFTGALQVSVVVIVFVFFCLAITTFTCVSYGIVPLLYCILGLMSGLFAFCICVFVLAAGSIWRDDSTIGCNKEYLGIFEYFRQIDQYFYLVDQKFCSDACPCTISNQTAMDELVSVMNTNYWYFVSTPDVVEGSISFDQCKPEVREEVLKTFNNMENTQKLIGKFNADQFAIYWRRIERKWKCTGWCQITYPDPEADPDETDDDLKYRRLQKYLFWDVNGGVVHNQGCMHAMIIWLPEMLNAFGSVLLLVGILQCFSAVFALALFCKCYWDSEDTNGSNEDDEKNNDNGVNNNNNGSPINLDEGDNKDEKRELKCHSNFESELDKPREVENR